VPKTMPTHEAGIEPITLNGVWGAFVCVFLPEYAGISRGQESRHGSSGRSASERKTEARFPRWQARSVGLAGGVHRAATLLATVIVNFQVVGNPVAAFVITQNDHVFGMMQVEELHASF